MATAAEEVARREIVRSALVKLTAGETLSRRELFEHPDYPEKTPYQQWKYELVGRLRERGIVEVTNAHPKHPEYRLVKGKSSELDEYLDDERKLTALIWPNAAPPPPNEGSDRQLTLVAAEAPVATDPAADEVGDSEFKALMVKYLGAMVENTIYLREKIDRLDEKINRLEKTIEETRGHTKKLADELG